MSPVRINDGPQGGQLYVSPFVGPNNHPAPVQIDPSLFFGSAWLDERGYVKPGTPIKADGSPVLDADVGPVAVGCVFEATRIVFPRSGEAITQVMLDAEANREIIVATIGQVNQDILEDLVARALTANEIAAIDDSKGIVRIA